MYFCRCSVSYVTLLCTASESALISAMARLSVASTANFWSVTLRCSRGVKSFFPLAAFPLIVASLRLSAAKTFDPREQNRQQRRPLKRILGGRIFPQGFGCNVPMDVYSAPQGIHQTLIRFPRELTRKSRWIRLFPGGFVEKFPPLLWNCLDVWVVSHQI